MERNISQLTDLESLSEFLNGASIEQTRFVPHDKALQCHIELIRACPEMKSQKRSGFLTRSKVPWVKSRLTLNGIQEISVERVEQLSIEAEPLIVCTENSENIRLVVNNPDGLRLNLTLPSVNGKFEDIGELVENP